MELINLKNTVIPSALTRDFLADATYPKGPGSWPLVIFCHGYKGFKDWGAWHWVAQAFAEAGFYFVAFNFSHNGTTLEKPEDFADLEAFGNNTYTKEQLDLEAVIAHYKEVKEVDSRSIALIGHSRGGGTVLVQALNNSAVTQVVTWAGVADFKKRFPRGYRLEAWLDKGVFYSENTRTKQQMPHYTSFYEDYIKNEEQLSVQFAAQHLKQQLLIVQGTADEAVPVKEAELLHLWCKGSQLLLLDGANHVFGSKHPWDEKKLPPDLTKVVEQTVIFLRK